MNHKVKLSFKTILLLGLTQAAFSIDCNLDLSSSNRPMISPFIAPKYAELPSPQDGNSLLTGAIISASANHIIPKSDGNTVSHVSYRGIRQIWSDISKADDKHKLLIVQALRLQVMAGIGDPLIVTNRANSRYIHSITYPNSIYGEQPRTNDVVSKMNQLIKGTNDYFRKTTPGTYTDIRLIEYGASSINTNQNPNKPAITSFRFSTPGSNSTVMYWITDKDSANAKAQCDAFRNTQPLFLWNPSNLFYSPYNKSRSWDPSFTGQIQSPADAIDSWILHINKNPRVRLQVNLLESMVTRTVGPNSYNSDAHNMANVIAGDLSNNASLSINDAKANLLLKETGFDPNNWQYNVTPQKSGYCPILLKNGNQNNTACNGR